MNRTMKYQGAFSRIVGFAGKRFLFSPPPPPPPSIFFAPLQLSRYTSTGNACYAGYHYGRREGERRKGGRWRGEKNTPARYHCSFGKLRTLPNGAPDWCGIGKQIDACQLTVSLYCLFRFRQSFGIGAAGNVACITAMRKSKLFLHWSAGQDLLTLLKPTPLLPHAKMLLVPIRFFFWRVDYALEGSMF